MTICHEYIRAVSSPNDTCKRTPSVVSTMALMVASTILPPDSLTSTWSPTFYWGKWRRAARANRLRIWVYADGTTD